MVIPYKVTIRNSGESFYVGPGETILNAAKRQSVTLPYGCDNGVCGACIYRIIEGRVEYPDGQPFALFEEDLEAGKGLCCVGYPGSDMLIELEYPNVDFEPWT
jgi:ferredoxin